MGLFWVEKWKSKNKLDLLRGFGVISPSIMGILTLLWITITVKGPFWWLMLVSMNRRMNKDSKYAIIFPCRCMVKFDDPLTLIFTLWPRLLLPLNHKCTTTVANFAYQGVYYWPMMTADDYIDKTKISIRNISVAAGRRIRIHIVGISPFKLWIFNEMPKCTPPSTDVIKTNLTEIGRSVAEISTFEEIASKPRPLWP